MEEHSQPFDICIVCALAEEANAVIHEFSDRCENVRFQQALSEKHRYPYRYTTLTNGRAEPLRLLVVGMPFTGPVETALNVRSLLSEFHPRFVAMTGICAGYREKVALGDLVAASYAFYFDEGKVEAGKDGQDTLRPEWRPHGPPTPIIYYLQAFTAWESTLVEMKERLLGRKLQLAEHPQCFIAPMASSMAVQGNNPFSRLLEGNRKAWFLDQEVAAFYHALHEHSNVSFLAVKSVCDYADPTKNDDYHEYAARASAVYLLHFIQEYVTEETMPRRDALLPLSGRRHFYSATHSVETNSPPHLEIFPPAGGEPMVVPLTKTRITIGRDPSYNDIVLQPDPHCLVSREEHCFLKRQGTSWYIGSHRSKRNPTLLKQGGALCFVQNNVPLADGSRIYIQGGQAETGEPLFWKCRFHDPQGTQPGQVAPYLAYEWRSHKLLRVVGGVSDMIHLPPREDRLFQCLWAHNEEHHAPFTVSVSELMQAVWGKEADTHVPQELHRLASSLREKIEMDPDKPRFLSTAPGKGYMLNAFPLPEIDEEDTS